MPFEHLLQYEAEVLASASIIAEVLTLASYRAPHVAKTNYFFHKDFTSKDYIVGDSILVVSGTSLSYL